MINRNLLPTENETREWAERFFPTNLNQQMSFTLGVWNSVSKTLETASVKAKNINNV